MKGLFATSIGRKIAMALSAVFLMIFLIMHLSINSLSLFSADAFNQASHFMGTNPLIQYAMQPLLVIGVIFHFVMGFILEAKNKSARVKSYAKNAPGANSSWMSRNMLWSGLVILAFLILHFIDFWIPEMNTKYIQGDMSGMLDGTNQFRYFTELQHKFESPLRVGAYVISFILLAMHLLHGFNSAFQSVGAPIGRTKLFRQIGRIYAILIPAGFVIIALFHHFNH